MFHRRTALSAVTASVLSFPFFSRAASTAVGLTLPITGPQAEVAKDLRSGYEIALKGTGLDLIVLDDESNPEKAATNVKLFANNPNEIATSGIVGTPHAQAALPVAIQGGLPIVGIRSGARSLRTGKDGVYHLRSSFEEELDKLASLCAGAGYKKMAILFSDDAFGKGARDHFVMALKALKIGVLSEVSMLRNGENLSESTAKIAEDLKAFKEPAGVVLLLILKPMTAAAQSLRVNHGIVLPMFAMSFVGTKSFSLDQSPALRALGLVSAFPLPRASMNSLAIQFRSAMINADRKDLFESLTALEGYFYGSVLAQAANAGKTRDGLIKVLSRGMKVESQSVVFDQNYVGYHYLEIIHKDRTGVLRT